MKTIITRSFLAVLILGFIASCNNSSAKKEEGSTSSSDTTTSVNVSPISMEIKKFTDKEADCKSEDCTYIELKMPVVSGGVETAMNQINAYIDGVYREAVKARLAEPLGNSSIQAMCAAFIESYKLFMMEFPDSDQKWYLEIDGTESVIGTDYFTLVVNHNEYLGGAHGAAFTQLNSFDVSNGNSIDIAKKYGRDKILKLAETKFREKNKLTSDADLNDAGFMFKDGKFALPENMGLTKEGILLVYNSYEVASYAQGETRFIIPYSQLGDDV